MVNKEVKRCLASLVIGEMQIKTTKRSFPGASVAKNLPADGVNPRSRKTPRAAGQLSPGPTTTEPVLQSPGPRLPSPHVAATEACRPWSPRSAPRRVSSVRSLKTSSPHSPQAEGAPQSSEGPAQPEKKLNPRTIDATSYSSVWPLGRNQKPHVGWWRGGEIGALLHCWWM